jgi:hypothetical protein
MSAATSAGCGGLARLIVVEMYMKQVQLITIVVYAVIAVWYVIPWIRTLSRAQALIALNWVHVFRYSVLYLAIAQREGYAITDRAAAQITIGDLTGAATALLAIVLLRYRFKVGILVTWVLVVATIVDTAVIFRQRGIDPPHGDAQGPWWLIFCFFAPLVMVSVVLLVWQLLVRRHEPLGERRVDQQNASSVQHSGKLEGTAPSV